ncbi:hypothetical protein PR048_010742 [Dryococelus australis]|uniref:Uncharacterized protein n=1 Tax=Dryococelus australis TaxID=614101 RepID=A0ABQ9I3J9_9NEOP|nr:hypothetical protein PR048_010742 [Dryococelus australis]
MWSQQCSQTSDTTRYPASGRIYGKSEDMSCVMNPKRWNLRHLIFHTTQQLGEKIICDLYTHVKAYHQKLPLLEQQKSQETFAHFVCCQSLEHLDAHFKAIRIFQNPLSCVIVDVQPSLKQELIDLQVNDIIKDKCKEGSLVQFYNYLPEENYQKIKDFARSCLSIFGTTYRCEQTLSLLKFTKSKYRCNLSDQHLRDILFIQQTALESQFDTILASESKLHTFH